MKHFEMDLKFRQEQMCFANEQQEKDRQERMVQFSAEMELKKRELDLKVEEIAMMCSQTDAQLQALQMQSAHNQNQLQLAMHELEFKLFRAGKQDGSNEPSTK